jgi:putative DNA primase/helicase
MMNNYIKHLKRIPKELKDILQWVCWMLEYNHSNPQKGKKRPINIRTRKPASVTNPKDWGSFDCAVRRLKKGGVDGIGFVFTENDPYVGIDLDNCRDVKTGEIAPRAQKIINRFGSYTEVSPSGTGIHIIVKGRLPGKGINTGKIEIYDKGRYFTITGDLVPGTNPKIKNKPGAVNNFYRELIRPEGQDSSKRKRQDRQTDFEILAKLTSSDTSGKFSKLHTGDTSGYSSQSEAELAYCSYLTKVTSSAETIDRIFRTSKLYREKWDERRGELTYGEMTIKKVLKNPNIAIRESAAKEDPQYLVAQKVISKIGRRSIYSHAGQTRRWRQKSGVWKVAPDEEIKKIIQAIAHQNNISQNHVNSILGIIKTEVYLTVNPLNRHNRRVINCKSGELHFENGVWALKKHNRKSHSNQQIPVIYDTKAECKRFIIFLNQVFEPDLDKDDKIKLLQEFMGYALTANCQYERSLILVGSGGNGKSVILELLKALLGPNNVAAVQPNQLDNRFHLAHLDGKLANIITEIPKGSVIDDAKYKALVSGEMITADHKYGKPFDFEPYATLFIAANHLPHTKDFSHAFFRRNEILTFNVKFEGDDCDTTLKVELRKELPGILNFALEGLKRLYDTGNFTQVECSLNAKLVWEREADQVKAFVDDECVLDPSSKVETAVLYNKYTRWSDKNGVKSPCNINTFSTRLTRFGCEHGRGAKGVRMIAGIKFKAS